MKNLTINYANAWLMGIDPIATGKQLRKQRQKNHFTQEELSEKFERCDVTASRVAISMWENGKKIPSLLHIVFLAELYGCSLDELVISYRRSREGDDRDQPAPYYEYYLSLRRVYASMHIFVLFFFVTYWFMCILLQIHIIELRYLRRNYVMRISEEVVFLEEAFDVLNERCFESALSKPASTIQSTPHAHGHFTPY